MARYEDYEDLKKSVQKTWSSMALLLEKFGWSFFTDEAATQVEVYEILAEAFELADDSYNFVTLVSDEIKKLEKKIKLRREANSKDEADDFNAQLKYLVKYIRFNFREYIWIDYPEFDHNHFVWGCR